MRNLRSVSMTHIRPLGQFSKFYIAVLFLLSSCAQIKFVPNGRFTKDIMAHYCNDSLNIGITLFSVAEYSFENNGASKRIIRRECSIKNGRQLFNAESHFILDYGVLGLIGDSISSETKFDQLDHNGNTYWLRSFSNRKKKGYEMIFTKGKQYISLLFYPLKKNQDILRDPLRLGEINSDQLARGEIPCGKSVNAFAIADVFFAKGQYLTSEYLKHDTINHSVTDSEKNLFNQAIATYLSFSGEYEEADEFWSNAFKRGHFDTLKMRRFQDPDLESLAQNQILIFNEAHHKPENRYLLGLLLRRLREYGFKYLAIEGLFNMDGIVENGFPTFQNGFYLRDPIYANLIRHALSLDYTLINYDNSNGSSREETQAKNIYDQTIKDDPNAKVIVLSGFSHANESTSKNVYMASHLYEISGIPPFTIDQTTGSLYDFVLPEPYVQDSILILPQLDNSDRSYDMYILNRLEKTNWNNCFDNRLAESISIEIPKDSLWEKAKFQLVVFNQDELQISQENAIPVFTKIIDIKGNKVNLNLCPGKYLIRCSDIYGSTLYEKELLLQKRQE